MIREEFKMAWKPPTQKAFEAGEIPGKKEISAEEMANLDANRPSKDIEALFGGNKKEIARQIEVLPEVQQERLDELLPIGCGQAISDWLEELQDTKEFGIGAVVLGENFESEMMAEIASSGNSFLTSEVLKIAYLKELCPIIFYFGMGMVNDKLRVVVTSIPDWDKIGLPDASDISDIVAPNFLIKVTASYYDFDDSMSASEVRKEMIKLGFVEKHEIVV